MDPNQQPMSPAGLSPQPEMQSGFAPAPASPEDPTQSPMSQEEMRSNMDGMMSQLQNKNKDVKAELFSANNERNSGKGSLLQEIFDFFQSVGVDPSNPEEVQAFLAKLSQDNPEMFAQVQQVLERAMQEDQSSQDTGAMPPQNMNINPNEALQQNL